MYLGNLRGTDHGMGGVSLTFYFAREDASFVGRAKIGQPLLRIAFWRWMDGRSLKRFSPLLLICGAGVWPLTDHLIPSSNPPEFSVTTGAISHSRADISPGEYWDFTVNDHALRDLPAFLAKVRAIQKEEEEEMGGSAEGGEDGAVLRERKPATLTMVGHSVCWCCVPHISPLCETLAALLRLATTRVNAFGRAPSLVPLSSHLFRQLRFCCARFSCALDFMQRSGASGRYPPCARLLASHMRLRTHANTDGRGVCADVGCARAAHGAATPDGQDGPALPRWLPSAGMRVAHLLLAHECAAMDIWLLFLSAPSTVFSGLSSENVRCCRCRDVFFSVFRYRIWLFLAGPVKIRCQCFLLPLLTRTILFP